MDTRNYALVTASYWAFTLTDGALRMLVLLHFHSLGYSPVQLAFLFLLYEFCGVLTNLLGGWAGSRTGLKATLFAGLALQVVALVVLSLVQPGWAIPLSVGYVMVAQALSGVAKDLTKMSSKSAVKLLVSADRDGGTAVGGSHLLFKWVAVLTGSKNALKGIGFLLGGVLLDWIGFAPALWAMAGALALVLATTAVLLRQDLGKSKKRVKFTELFSKSREINLLSVARFFLFGARDIWFVVGLPVFLSDVMGWSFSEVGAILATWVIAYGCVQAIAPKLVRRRSTSPSTLSSPTPPPTGAVASHGARAATAWGFALTTVTAAIAVAVQFGVHPAASILVGLALFGVVFAVNSSLHSYLILAYTDPDQVALNVGFYYMANALGRLTGTLLSGVLYLAAGLQGCLWGSAVFVLAAAVITLGLPRHPASGDRAAGEHAT